MSNKEKILVIVGPTAVGKTALGIRLAQLFNGEIISGDSQQVYCHLDIGTAKATPAEQEAAPHHLINIREVTDTYSAFDFVKDAKEAINRILAKGKLPIIVGGTGLYLQSLLEGYHLGGNLDQEALLSYRKDLETLETKEIFAMVEKEGLIIPELNRRRAIRALELQRFGQDLSNQVFPYQSMIIGLNDERELIYDRINQRVDRMLASGLLEEAKWLFDHYPTAQASRAIGYKELFPYFRGEETLEEASAHLKQNTRRFAKRQLTWFRNRMAVDFYPISASDYPLAIEQKVTAFLED
ncbi:tRNA (adenosine(37)-N6)-dimethylallyltransferase MiaA [Streptococcus pseudoporcinus]|uniref:tRNA dimethylallyltransferase n=1 Tax=Streptococcus pseudoporcinus LQ 940-04 TaxID=875093 RepID=G5KAV3_9STRE|nr:tRNA (adenosine(37)-N6)-dimethylallyltransferase MiaA [Streptococcus pseudoporcinus]EFR44646.1 tRNA dimethylallyltransferase [Streptococcus pseudoporcinus SPIN 20026]EHI64636.1 tRNA dimethylallyltransferase [Streptococcus pseudoporcinus LQ 940-04]VEF93181.1 tRNA delta(2)-isopentenylpyrophosphate transferase [Streptococcus pseudoporcinus]